MGEFGQISDRTIDHTLGVALSIIGQAQEAIFVDFSGNQADLG